MKVYLVYFNNGEAYEDNYEYVTGVYGSYDKAVQAIEAQDFERMEELGYLNRPRWGRKVMASWYEEDDEEQEEYFTGIVEEMFIEEKEVQ